MKVASRPRLSGRWGLAALAYAALIAYGSLYPFSGWTARGVELFAFLVPHWSAHLSRADVVTNVLAYMPLGLLLARWWRNSRHAARRYRDSLVYRRPCSVSRWSSHSNSCRRALHPSAICWPTRWAR